MKFGMAKIFFDLYIERTNDGGFVSDRIIRCTIRVFKLLEFDKQELTVASEKQIEYKDKDTNFEYVNMIEYSAFENLKKQNEVLKAALNDIQNYNCGSDGFSASAIENNYKSQKAREALAQVEKMKGL